MATHTGVDGIVKIGSNAVAEVKSWSIEETGDTVEDTAMGDSWRTHKSTLKGWNGSLACFWDETDTTGQGALTPGASVTLNLYIEGETVGDTYFTGTALVTGISRSGSFDGLIEASFTFQGTGALTQSTVSA